MIKLSTEITDVIKRCLLPLEKTRDLAKNLNQAGSVYLHYPMEKKYARTIFCFDPYGGTSSSFELPQQTNFDFSMTRISQVDKTLYAFEFGNPVKAYKFEHIGTSRFHSIELASLQRNLDGFAIAVHAPYDFYLTGGMVTDEVWKYSAKLDKWLDMPRMNHARSSHASIVLRNHLYVMGGSYKGGSIECLLLVPYQRWAVLIE